MRLSINDILGKYFLSKSEENWDPCIKYEIDRVAAKRLNSWNFYPELVFGRKLIAHRIVNSRKVLINAMTMIEMFVVTEQL